MTKAKIVWFEIVRAFSITKMLEKMEKHPKFYYHFKQIMFLFRLVLIPGIE